LGISLIRKGAQRIICFAHFTYYFIVRICREYLKHLLSRLFIFSLPLNNQQYTIDYFSFDCTGGIIHFAIENFKGSVDWIVKLRWRFVCMGKKINQYLFHFTVLRHWKSFNEIFDPNFCVVFQILSCEFIKVFSNNKPFISDTIYNTRN
jgi:hypothetical protein